MTKNILCKLLFALAFVNYVFCETKESPPSPIEKDVCRQLCANKALHLNNEGTAQCERGCRFFNIAMNTNWSVEKTLDLNATKEQCCQTCSDAYPEEVRGNCFTGCCEMQQLQKDAWLFYLEQQGEGNMFEIEVSVVSDPDLWQPSDPTANNPVYKIPQTMLRTMPLRPELSEVLNGKPWTTCTHTTEIPRWLVGMVAIVLTFVTLYVSFILPRSQNDSNIIIENIPILGDSVDSQDEDDDFQFNVKSPSFGLLNKDSLPEKNCYVRLEDESPEKKLLTLNEFLTEEIHINIPPPPKYTPFPEGQDRKI